MPIHHHQLPPDCCCFITFHLFNFSPHTSSSESHHDHICLPHVSRIMIIFHDIFEFVFRLVAIAECWQLLYNVLRLRLRLRFESLGSRCYRTSAHTQLVIPLVPLIVSTVCRYLAHHPCSRTMTICRYLAHRSCSQTITFISQVCGRYRCRCQLFVVRYMPHTPRL